MFFPYRVAFLEYKPCEGKKVFFKITPLSLNLRVRKRLRLVNAAAIFVMWFGELHVRKLNLSVCGLTYMSMVYCT